MSITFGLLSVIVDDTDDMESNQNVILSVVALVYVVDQQRLCVYPAREQSEADAGNVNSFSQHGTGTLQCADSRKYSIGAPYEIPTSRWTSYADSDNRQAR